MALSQIQCLDDHHVNWRVSEGKPEFFYSEDQRLALEALLYAGREGFAESLDARGTRGFLSEPELERITRTAEAYRPGFEHPPKPEAAGAGNVTPGSAEDGGDGAVSLQYWPDRSEGSVAELDLGWPDAISYRGVTRVAVHTQPPTEGHTHIKEVVRKSIALAQKVIAVVMDVFTDVDIFRDLLDAAFKRKVPVYIIIDQAAVPCFLSMCGRADMHRGHLKNLRVRCCGGVEFYTRSAQKVRGSLSQKFLLVDGDKAISGSYSFTWSSSRLDRNLITVITGQAVETFDIQFRDLFLTSRGVSLSKVSLAEEPMPDIVPQAAPVPVSAAIARKLINPKYALVTTGNHASLASSDQNSSNKNSAGQNPTGLRLIKGRIKETVEGPPLHPGLAHLEKAYLIPYLPTWPEPDPPSDVIGFINIRDDKRANQVHLQRSERFEVSQAIRFSSPFTPPAKTDAHAAGQAEEAADAATHPSKSEEAPSPLTESNTQPSVQQHTSKNTEHTDERDSSASPQQPNTPQAKRTRNTNSHPKKSETQDAIALQPKETSQQAPEAEAAARPLAPPIPKPRTLQLVIDPSGQSCQPQVSLIKKKQSDPPACSPEVQIQEDPEPVRGHGQSEEAGKDSESNGEGSQDSTKVICDPAANDNPSSDSTGSDEFYDCSAPETSDALANGVKTGSGRGHRQGDGINVMARLSQSMLDLRAPCPSEDSMALLYQSQQLRRQAHQSPHRHIGQLFQASRSPDREGQMIRAKVILAKPGSFPRAPGASGPVIGGHRYWQDATLQTDSGRTCQEGRSGRSPRRHSPGCRKSGQGCPQPPPNPAGVLGVSFSKLTNLRHLRARGGGSQKRTTHSNKDVS